MAKSQMVKMAMMACRPLRGFLAGWTMRMYLSMAMQERVKVETKMLVPCITGMK